jgi:hypothetical protein
MSSDCPKSVNLKYASNVPKDRDQVCLSDKPLTHSSFSFHECRSWMDMNMDSVRVLREPTDPSTLPRKCLKLSSFSESSNIFALELSKFPPSRIRTSGDALPCSVGPESNTVNAELAFLLSQETRRDSERRKRQALTLQK